MEHAIICAACGQPITGADYEERHWGHEVAVIWDSVDEVMQTIANYLAAMIEREV